MLGGERLIYPGDIHKGMATKNPHQADKTSVAVFPETHELLQEYTEQEYGTTRVPWNDVLYTLLDEQTGGSDK